MPDLILHSECLLSKWGFSDGDIPEQLLDALDDAGLDYGGNWRPALRQLVREHLAPKLDQDVELVDIETIHNPIRAEKVDGVEIDWFALDHPVTLTPDHVRVPMAEVIRIYRQTRKDTP